MHYAKRQRAFAAALTVAVLAALAAVGGVSYAATAVTHAAKHAAKLVAPATKNGAVVVKGPSAGGDQYRPGYGFGDPNHNHTGPPGLTRGKPGEKAPPAQTTKSRDGKAVFVSTSITLDEQAALYFAVVDSAGHELLLSQEGSKVGSGLDGPQTKSIHYVVLVPRTIRFALRIPANQLVQGKTYFVRIIAIDPDGNKVTRRIPFTA